MPLGVDRFIGIRISKIDVHASLRMHSRTFQSNSSFYRAARRKENAYVEFDGNLVAAIAPS
jgi:hypothetical protein